MLCGAGFFCGFFFWWVFVCWFWFCILLLVWVLFQNASLSIVFDRKVLSLGTDCLRGSQSMEQEKFASISCKKTHEDHLQYTSYTRVLKLVDTWLDSWALAMC